MSEAKSELERIYTVSLSRAWIVPRHRRTKRAINMLKEYAEKHMKSSEVKIETSLNEEMWTRGITHPPRRITVKMSRDEDGVVTISLPKEKKEEEPAKETPIAESPSKEAPFEEAKTEKVTAPKPKSATKKKTK